MVVRPDRTPPSEGVRRGPEPVGGLGGAVGIICLGGTDSDPPFLTDPFQTPRTPGTGPPLGPPPGPLGGGHRTPKVKAVWGGYLLLTYVGGIADAMLLRDRMFILRPSTEHKKTPRITQIGQPGHKCEMAAGNVGVHHVERLSTASQRFRNQLAAARSERLTVILA